MLQQFKSMNELVQYLGTLEERVKCLEEENRQLRLAPPPTASSNVDERTVAKYVASFLPLTNIVHPNFWKRAFAVWGHFFVANLIISIPFVILYSCLMSMVLRQLSRNP